MFPSMKARARSARPACVRISTDLHAGERCVWVLTRAGVVLFGSVVPAAFPDYPRGSSYVIADGVEVRSLLVDRHGSILMDERRVEMQPSDRGSGGLTLHRAFDADARHMFLVSLTDGTIQPISFPVNTPMSRIANIIWDLPRLPGERS